MTQEARSSQGYVLLVMAYAIWGFSPVYWKSLAKIPALELLLHRTVWSFVFLLALVVFQKRTTELIQALTNPRTLFSLLGTTLVTALPLLLFTMGARKVPLATVGFMQYMAPTLSFLLAIFMFDEPFSSKQLVTFVMIWAALAFYSADSLFMMRRAKRSFF